LVFTNLCSICRDHHDVYGGGALHHGGHRGDVQRNHRRDDGRGDVSSFSFRGEA